MKIREYFGELKTPMQIAAEYIAAAYFNGDINEVERDDLQNYIKEIKDLDKNNLVEIYKKLAKIMNEANENLEKI